MPEINNRSASDRAQYLRPEDGEDARLLYSADGRLLGVRQTNGSYRNIDPHADVTIRTAYGEADGEGPVGQAAIAAVMLNRAAASGKTLTEVAMEPSQFEPWMTPATRKRLNALSPSGPAYQRVADAVLPILMGEAPDPTGGATDFYSPSAQRALGRPAPTWDDGRGVDIGRHRFFNGIYAKRFASHRRFPGAQRAAIEEAPLAIPRLGAAYEFGDDRSPPSIFEEVMRSPLSGGLMARISSGRRSRR